MNTLSNKNAKNPFGRFAIVVVTYKRQDYLRMLLDSYCALHHAPWRIIIVDNENSPETHGLIKTYQEKIAAGDTACSWPEYEQTFVYFPLEENTGGAGGFAAGMREAYRLGAEWIWVMDDDVVVMPDALNKLGPWMADYEVIQGSRQDFDGGPFNWQYRFVSRLGIYNPIKQAIFKPGEHAKQTNTACFEGGLFKRSVLDKIGFPDKRFFIYWDDCVYGYMASKVTNSVVVDDLILRRSRNIAHKVGPGVRQLNSTSDMVRYHIMRNRGHMAHYLKMQGEYTPALFGLGTLLSFAKEGIRLCVLDNAQLKSGARALIAGWKESRRIIHDKNWQPITGVVPTCTSVDETTSEGINNALC